MVVSYSHKRVRDQRLIEGWHQRLETLSADHGFSREDIEDLKVTQYSLRGKIVLPGDESYNQDRLLFNPIFDAHPKIIVFCETESDVNQALRLALNKRLTFSIRSGGHCTAGFSAGEGMLIDVRKLDSILVDPTGMTVTVGCGCPFGDLFQTLHQYRSDEGYLHVPGGECPDVCIGGYVQGGGYGFTSASFGMNSDNVLSMRVMLWDGSIVEASNDVNYDLWWAMRGGTGGNFGVLLNVTYRLHRLGDVYGWAIAWPLDTTTGIEQAAEVMLLLQREYMLTSRYARLMNIQVSFCFQHEITPDAAPSTGEPTGPLKPYLMVRGLYVGSESEGREAILPLRKMPGALWQWDDFTSFFVLNEKLLNYPESMPTLSAMPFEAKSSHYVEKMLTGQDWSTILSYFAAGPNNRCYGYLEFYGGTINGYPAEDSAFIHRSAAYNAVMDAYWLKDTDRVECENFLTGWSNMMETFWNGHTYQNYPNFVVPSYGWNYWGGAQAGLAAVKNKYDPGNRFTFQQAVHPPSGNIDWPIPPALRAALKKPIERLTTAA